VDFLIGKSFNVAQIIGTIISATYVFSLYILANLELKAGFFQISLLIVLEHQYDYNLISKIILYL